MVDLIKRIRKPANQVRASELCQRKITILSIRRINPTEKRNVVITFLLLGFNHNVRLKGFGELQRFCTIESISQFESGVSELFDYQPAGCFPLAISFSG